MSDRVYSLDDYRKESRKSQTEEALAGQFRQAGITGWEREYRFHPVRKWRFDFAFVEQKIGIEVEGLAKPGKKSRHTEIAGYREDCRKYNEAIRLGWKLLRFEQSMVASGEALRVIEQVLKGQTA